MSIKLKHIIAEGIVNIVFFLVGAYAIKWLFGIAGKDISFGLACGANVALQVLVGLIRTSKD